MHCHLDSENVMKSISFKKINLYLIADFEILEKEYFPSLQAKAETEIQLLESFDDFV
jgi:hypothetical protein